MGSGDASLRAAMRVFVTTRVAVFLIVAVFAALVVRPVTGGKAEENAVNFDAPALTYSFGGLGDPRSPRSRAGTPSGTCEIADTGYGDSEARAAFFPLYPG